MGRLRIASMTAALLLVCGVVADVTLGGSTVPAVAAGPASAGSTKAGPEQVVEDWASAADWSADGVSVYDGRVHGSAAEVAGAFRALDPRPGTTCSSAARSTSPPGRPGG